MSKIYGLQGVMTGKLGNSVMSVRNGVQIARQYQPIVSNPSTDAQVAARARLKLMSQLSAVMAPVIAIPSQRNVSSRNLFTSVNYGASSFSNGQATITLAEIKLTKGVLALPPLRATRADAALTVSLTQAAGADLSRVVYALFRIQDDNTLRYVASSTVTTGGTDNVFSTSINLESAAGNFVVYAYGLRDNTEAARVAFGDLTVISAENVARIITSRVLLESDVTLTETRGLVSTPQV